MKFLNPLAAAIALATMHVASAAPSADEIKQLGTTLTPWGAERAGNKDGTIPAYDGGIKNPPKVDYKSGILPDPFPEDKVLFWIDAKNMDRHADKLSPGTAAMLKKYPTFRIAVYQTRRSATYPAQVIDNTVKNANRCSLKDEGETLDVSTGCRGGFPFPVPKTGYEAMWNQRSNYMGPARLRLYQTNVVKPSGESVMMNKILTYEDNGLYDPDVKVPWRHWSVRSEYKAPTRLVGSANLLMDMLQKNERKSWSYQPATRRTRLAPDLAGDTPIATSGGSMVYDEIGMFSGSTDRWNVKLLGKKEMYIPYNAYRMGDESVKHCTIEGGLYQKHHMNPECVRWELHRVWHVQAALKEGRRHVYGKRDLFFDEDTWYGGLQDSYDHNGNIYRVSWAPVRPDYNKLAPTADVHVPVFDLVSDTYSYTVTTRRWVLDKPLPASSLTPESLQTHLLKEPN